jgi:hypothetical protein
MNSTLAMHNSPRCHATSKRSGLRCEAPAVKGWEVCHFHGAGGGAPKGKANGAYRHGAFTAEAVAQRRAFADLIRQCRAGLQAITGDD